MSTARWIRSLVMTVTVAQAAVANAEQVTITGYDVEQTPGSGWGCWSHTYTGTISDTGRTVGGGVVCTPEGSKIFDYSVGGGTLNDGVIGITIDTTHLFTTRNADDGQPVIPVITLHLAGTFFVNQIDLYGGGMLDNALPGALDGLTVEIGGSTLTLATTPLGAPNAIGVPANDRVDLTGTPLASIPTNQIVLKNFTSSLFGSPFDQFSITEIIIDGTALALTVAIDIKPGGSSNPINMKSRGKIPVAILSSMSFNAPGQVDRTSLTFGHSGNEDSLDHCGGPKDVNGDGLPDVVCHFNTQATHFVAGDTRGILKGRTLAGDAIQGTDSVRIIH